MGPRTANVLGFSAADFKSWRSFVALLNKPKHPASLALTRILFGFLMMRDLIRERGFMHVASHWLPQEECRFPFIDFLQPLPIQWMIVLYMVMGLGLIGITVGLLYRISCLLYIVPYWYLFLLQPSFWNNHSYLFGLLGTMLLLTDATNAWSLDALFWKGHRYTAVPLWNYALLRGQVLLVYTIAGLKKMDPDWLTGYSMKRLHGHPVFLPFRFILPDEVVSVFVVHFCGFFLDLTGAFWCYFDRTRPYGMAFLASFHVMNSLMFSIGQFPYIMLALTPVFCYPDWPLALWRKLARDSSEPMAAREPVSTEVLECGAGDASTHGLEPGTVTEPPEHNAEPVKRPTLPAGGESNTDKDLGQEMRKPHRKCTSISSTGLHFPQRSAVYQHFGAAFFLAWLALQCFLPYSHFITKGLNTWKEGYYGYSWDMMIRSWSLKHFKITFVDRDTGVVSYLHPEAYVKTSGRRYMSNAPMIKQYAMCVNEHLLKHGVNASIYIDTWMSMNSRLSQRMFDPRVDLVTAKWSLFQETSWVFPLMYELSHWRTFTAEFRKQHSLRQNFASVEFIADFPGLTLENFVETRFGKTVVNSLYGEVVLETGSREHGNATNTTLSHGQNYTVPAGDFHWVHTLGSTPSCYAYIYIDTKLAALHDKAVNFMDAHNVTWSELEKWTAREENKSRCSEVASENEKIYCEHLSIHRTMHDPPGGVTRDVYKLYKSLPAIASYYNRWRILEILSRVKRLMHASWLLMFDQDTIRRTYNVTISPRNHSTLIEFFGKHLNSSDILNFLEHERGTENPVRSVARPRPYDEDSDLQDYTEHTAQASGASSGHQHVEL